MTNMKLDEKPTFKVGDIIWIKKRTDHYLLALLDGAKIIPIFLNNDDTRGYPWAVPFSVENEYIIPWYELEKNISAEYSGEKNDYEFGLVESGGTEL